MTGAGTPSQGEKDKTTYAECRRCGEKPHHVKKEVCSSHGLGKSKKHRSCAWQPKSGDN